MVGFKTSWAEAETIAIREQLNRMLSCELFAQASWRFRLSLLFNHPQSPSLLDSTNDRITEAKECKNNDSHLVVYER